MPNSSTYNPREAVHTIEAKHTQEPCLTKEADARLIAAAPDLLQAAKGVAYSNGFDAALPEKMEALRAAIAKATGQ